MALKVTQSAVFSYDYTNLTAKTTAKYLTTHEEFTVDTHYLSNDSQFTQARTSGLKFYSSTTYSNDVLVVTCKPGKYKFSDNSSGINGFLEPATLSFTLKSNLDDVITVDLDVPGETSDYKNIVSCDAMDISAFNGETEGMEISDMETHIFAGNIKRVSLVSHEHTGVVTVDYDSTSPVFTKSTDKDALNC